MHNDAVFIVDTPSDMSASAEGSDISSGTIPDTNMDTVTSSEYQQDLGMDLINPDEGSDRVEPYAKSEQSSGQDTIGAHMLMLSQ